MSMAFLKVSITILEQIHILSQCALYLGSFTNYVDTFLVPFDPLSPSVNIFYNINVDKKSTFLDYLVPTLVNVVCERPLISIWYDQVNEIK